MNGVVVERTTFLKTKKSSIKIPENALVVPMKENVEYNSSKAYSFPGVRSNFMPAAVLGI